MLLLTALGAMVAAALVVAVVLWPRRTRSEPSEPTEPSDSHPLPVAPELNAEVAGTPTGDTHEEVTTSAKTTTFQSITTSGSTPAVSPDDSGSAEPLEIPPPAPPGIAEALVWANDTEAAPPSEIATDPTDVVQAHEEVEQAEGEPAEAEHGETTEPSDEVLEVVEVLEEPQPDESTDEATEPTADDRSVELEQRAAEQTYELEVRAQRIEDLETQVEFLDDEVQRYREQLESHRIEQSRLVANLAVQADAALDEHRRAQQAEIEELHDHYRDAIAARQIGFDEQLAALEVKHQRDLDNQHGVYEQRLSAERRRVDIEISAAQSRISEEHNSDAASKLNAVTHTLQQRDHLVDELRAEARRLRHDLSEAIESAEALQARSGSDERERARAVEELRRDVEKLERQNASLVEQMQTERRQAAATLAEVMEQSAVVARELDAAERTSAAERAEAAAASEAEVERARADYETLLEAADERVRMAFDREAELEALIAQLRSRGLA